MLIPWNVLVHFPFELKLVVKPERAAFPQSALVLCGFFFGRVRRSTHHPFVSEEPSDLVTSVLSIGNILLGIGLE